MALVEYHQQKHPMMHSDVPALMKWQKPLDKQMLHQTPFGGFSSAIRRNNNTAVLQSFKCHTKKVHAQFFHFSYIPIIAKNRLISTSHVILA